MEIGSHSNHLYRDYPGSSQSNSDRQSRTSHGNLNPVLTDSSDEGHLATMQDIVIEQILSSDGAGQGSSNGTNHSTSNVGGNGGGAFPSYSTARVGRLVRPSVHQNPYTLSPAPSTSNYMDSNSGRSLAHLSASTRMLMGTRMNLAMEKPHLAKEYDVVEVNLHDQLPSSEDYRLTQGLTGGGGTGSGTLDAIFNTLYFHRLKIFAVFALLSLCVSFTMLGIFIDRRNNGGGAAPGSMITSGSGSDDVTQQEIIGVDGNIVLEGQTRYEQMVSLIKQMGWSAPQAFDSQRTPQSKAAYFVSTSDTLQLPIDPSSVSLKQRYVLAILFYSTDGPNSWIRRFQFLTEEPECSWNEYWSGNEKDDISDASDNVDGFHPVGVICDNTPTIRRLYFPSNNLVGDLPVELGLLTDLKEMNFYDNSITGKIHGTWQYLKNLEALVLYKNQIRDVVPMWIGDELRNLQVLNLGNNPLYGTLPSNLDLIPTLSVLNCEHTEVDGTLQPLHNASSLESIHFGNSSLSGELHEDVFNSWTNLKELDLGNNMLVGTLPRSLLDNDHLMMIDLHGNQFTGEIYDVNPNSSIRVLALNDNKLTGRIDSLISNLPAAVMQHLDLSNNMFVGEGVPSSIGKLTQLRYLFLANLKGVDRDPIPTEIGKLTDLVDLSLQNSNRIGSIPYEIKALTKLVLLDLNNNYLSQDIPEELSALKELRFLLLRNNELSGPIPDGLLNLENLDTFVVDTNTNINSGARSFCQLNLESLRVFQADCSTFTKIDGEPCACCTKCCDRIDADGTNGNDDTCKDDIFFADMDPSSEYQYVRKFYKLHEEDVIFPVKLPKVDPAALPMFEEEDGNDLSKDNATPYVYAPYNVVTQDEQLEDAVIDDTDLQPTNGDPSTDQIGEPINPWSEEIIIDENVDGTNGGDNGIGDGNYGVNGDGSYGENGDGSYGDNGDGNYGDNGAGNYGDNGDGNYGDNGDGNYGDNGDGNYGDNGIYADYQEDGTINETNP